jgi:hypothetical protein
MESHEYMLNMLFNDRLFEVYFSKKKDYLCFLKRYNYLRV